LELTGVILLSLFFLIFALVCLKWPDKIIENAMKSKDNRILGKENPWRDRVKPSQYEVILKFVGLLALIAFFIACYTIVSEVL
jgi:succinate dehydrogenase hydrophobic anchor subunit